MKIYGCIGEVRGDCGHRHKKLHCAVQCVRQDRVGCKNQGGYSDRIVYERTPGPGGFNYAGLDRYDWEWVYGEDGVLVRP